MTAITYTDTRKVIHYIEEDEVPFIEDVGQQSPFGSSNVTVSLLQKLHTDGQVRKGSWVDQSFECPHCGSWSYGLGHPERHHFPWSFFQVPIPEPHRRCLQRSIWRLPIMAYIRTRCASDFIQEKSTSFVFKFKDCV